MGNRYLGIMNYFVNYISQIIEKLNQQTIKCRMNANIMNISTRLTEIILQNKKYNLLHTWRIQMPCF